MGKIYYTHEDYRRDVKQADQIGSKAIDKIVDAGIKYDDILKIVPIFGTALDAGGDLFFETARVLLKTGGWLGTRLGVLLGGNAVNATLQARDVFTSMRQSRNTRRNFSNPKLVKGESRDQYFYSTIGDQEHNKLSQKQIKALQNRKKNKQKELNNKDKPNYSFNQSSALLKRKNQEMREKNKTK